jgi:hypothetical protein
MALQVEFGADGVIPVIMVPADKMPCQEQTNSLRVRPLDTLFLPEETEWLTSTF